VVTRFLTKIVLMRYYALKTLSAIWIMCCTAYALSGCISGPSVRDKRSEQLPLGLFQVIERACVYLPGAPEDCTKTQYLELAKNNFEGAGKDEIGFTTWLSDSPDKEHTYNTRDLRRGRFLNRSEYMIEDDESEKEWFVIKGGVLTDYYFIRHARQSYSGEMAGKTHLTLKRVARTNEINRLLHYFNGD
jgi:hypothetical protein